MQIDDWHSATELAFACELEVRSHNAGELSEFPRLLLVFNPHSDSVEFNLPAACWRLLVDSSATMPLTGRHQQTVQVPEHTALVFREIVLLSD
jgi:pullulanase/glycogen debranching enzyme